ncbi:MAG: NAD-dependent epimerase/dehydratase family protein [Chloroflexi bacterium]|nr:NAD-dependent epimerase/dehydratase family protein [Chloroflexota bacterium]
MSTLVTGGAGFIGAEVVHGLLAGGEKRPFIFSRNPNMRLLDDVADQVELISGDLGNFSHVLDAVKAARPEVIYHFGAMLSLPSDADPAAAIHTNAMGTFHVLEAARLFDVRQVIFSSSISVYGSGIHGDVIDDFTLQRPQLFYGVTKVFGEQMGLFYRRKYAVDFRCIRYPSVIGPGARTPGAVQYTSWVIEECAKGNPFTINVNPDTRVPVMYIKEAGQAAIMLAEAPVESIKTVNYNIDGVKPSPSAGELADAVRAKLPDAKIEFKPDPELQAILDEAIRPFDDTNARNEWGWQPGYRLERIVDDFLGELKQNPQRYE